MEELIEFTSKPKDGEPWDVAIIGSGPAALTAAIYTTRGAASTLILGGDKWGGQLMLTSVVDNFPGFAEGVEGPDLMVKMKRQAERFGAEFVEKNVEGVDFEKQPFELLSDGVKYLAKTIIISTGAETKWLGVPGEQKLIGRGVSSCAPCDAPFFKDKHVAVVGGGDSAMEEALVLAKYATKVTVIHRRNELKASAAMQKRVFSNKKISFVWNTGVVEILGENKIEKLKLKTNKDSNQAKELVDKTLTSFNAEYKEEKDGELHWEMPVDGVFVAIGHIPSTQLFQGKIDTDELGYVVKRPTEHEGKINEEKHFNSRTNIPGVFVAGDVHDYAYRQAITAAGFGCMAGMDALRYLDKNIPTW